LEESELSPENKNKSESLSENNEILSEEKKSENFSEVSNQVVNKDNSSPDNIVDKNESLFNRFLKEGFDGITTNPNYKLLALLIILLINLSLFLLVGNLGKNFLQNSGLLS
tara:strand:- start:1507 stop:1839 length:333 start_codon:yes stop_codon:yes gene_type:complete